VVSFPPTIVITPLGEVCTACLRERSSVDPSASSSGHHREQEIDLIVAGLRDVGDRVHRLIRQANEDRPIRLRNGKHPPAARAGHGDVDRGLRRPDALGTQDEMRPAAGSQADVLGEGVSPHPGGVDHGAGRDGDLGAGQLVAQHR
jgi:hypothetical protein